MQIGLFKVGKDWLALWFRFNRDQRASHSNEKGEKRKKCSNGKLTTVREYRMNYDKRRMKMKRARWFVAALALIMVFGLFACGPAAETPAPTEERVYEKPQITPIPTSTPRIINPECLDPEYNSDKTEVRASCGEGFFLILSKCSFSDKVLGVVQAGSKWISIPKDGTVEFFFFRYDAELRANQLKEDGYYVMPDSRWIFDADQYTE